MVSLMKALLAAVALVAVMEFGLVGANFQNQCSITWGPKNAKMTEGGEHLTLSLTNTSGSALKTLKSFIYGSVSTRIMLVKGDSAGTVTTYYTSSTGKDDHDEIDFEFLGNSTDPSDPPDWKKFPYTIHTNVFADGVGAKEMQFRPWFDPTADYHNYTIFWNPCMIVWYVDSIPIRVFRNYKKEGVPFPTKRQMYGFSSLWNADDWATQGGRVKTNWTLAPFVAEYRDLNLQVCECADGVDDATCYSSCAASKYAVREPCKLNDVELHHLKNVQLGYTIYDYCAGARESDGKIPIPLECDLGQY